ncbi:MAG TPA: hypothetical protein VGS21_03480, partial [Acidimicrobiales bacterium]|nr:hypothetical protein [Acidimicrobiales bacterium]
MLDLAVSVPRRERSPALAGARTAEETARFPAAWSPAAVAMLAAMMFALLVAGVIRAATAHLSTDGAATRLFALTPGFAGMSEDGGNMALYYLLVHVLVDRFGAAPIVLRLPSVLAGAASVPVVANLGRRAWSPRVGVVAAAIFT